MSLLIAQITDTHIMAKGKYYANNPVINTAANLQSVVTHINSLRPLPNIVIHTGDITDKGDIESYSTAKVILDELKMPYYLTCGNHDIYANMCQVFHNHTYLGNDEFACFSIEYKRHKLVVVDSVDQGKISGILCKRRLSWLKAQLDTEKEVSIFMHHYPSKVQHEFFNTLSLVNSQEFSQIVKNPNVKGIYCGHYHITGASIFNGKICWISPGISPAFHLDGSDNVTQCTKISLTPPSFSLHLMQSKEENISRVITCCKIIDRM